MDRAAHRIGRAAAVEAVTARQSFDDDAAELQCHPHAAPAASSTFQKPESMRRQRRTKGVATLGPASGDRSTIARLLGAGADVFRINMSHTGPERMRELVASIRSVEA